MDIFWLAFVFLLGLEFGSFANVCIYRWPRQMSVQRPRRSQCPWCGNRIAWWNNIPVISFLCLRGHCRSCHSPISWQYPIVEITMAITWTLFYHHAARSAGGSAPFLILGFSYFFVLLVTTGTDLEWKIIPDRASLFLIGVGICLSPWNSVFTNIDLSLRMASAILGAAIGGTTLWLVGRCGEALLGREVMGMGDVKLLAGIGAVLGWRGAFLTLLVASLVGGVVAAVGLLTGHLHRRQYIPFGPFLNLGAAAVFAQLLPTPALPWLHLPM